MLIDETMVRETRDMLRKFDFEQRRIVNKPVRDITGMDLSSLEFVALYASKRLSAESLGYIATSLSSSTRNFIEDVRAVQKGQLSAAKVRRISSNYLELYDRLR